MNFNILVLPNVEAALVAAHGIQKKSSLPMGGHKGGPYIFPRPSYFNVKEQLHGNYNKDNGYDPS